MNNLVKKGNSIKIFFDRANEWFQKSINSHMLLKYVWNTIFENIDPNISILKIDIFSNLSVPSGANKQRFAL